MSTYRDITQEELDTLLAKYPELVKRTKGDSEIWETPQSAERAERGLLAANKIIKTKKWMREGHDMQTNIPENGLNPEGPVNSSGIGGFESIGSFADQD